MSMASYNLLKAAADGLADAINYRTNLKRRRREEEYNYNRDWQRNENEYQRDLGRERDKLDYTTDYNWKQQQRAHDRDIEWNNQKREADKARILGFADAYNPANVNRHDWSDVQNFNLNALANDIPLSIKYEDLESLDKDMKNKLAVLEKEHQYKMAQIDAQNKGRAMGRGSSGRQPSLTPYEKLQHDLSMARTPEEREMILQLHRVAPRAVKGSSGKGAILEQGGISRDQYNRIYDLYNKLNTQKSELAKLQSSGSLYGGNDYDSMIAEVEKSDADDETKAQKIARINSLKIADTRSRTNSVQSYYNRISEMEKELDRLIKEATGGTKGYSPDKDKGLFYDIIDNKNKKIKSFFADDEMLDDEAVMNGKRKNLPPTSVTGAASAPISVASAPVTLYSENPAATSSTDIMPEQIPSSVAPLPVRDGIATPSLSLQQTANSNQVPYSLKPLPDLGLPKKETNMELLERALNKLAIPVTKLYNGGLPLVLNVYNLYDARQKGLINDDEYYGLLDVLYETAGGR